MQLRGWYQVAFEREIESEVSPATLGAARLVVVRSTEGLRVFDATCPHRGAHLGCGGVLDRQAIRCPFHGYRIGLDDTAETSFRAREYTALTVGGMVFIRLSGAFENGLKSHLDGLDQDHFFVPGFELNVSAPAQLVIENAFDEAHFRIGPRRAKRSSSFRIAPGGPPGRSRWKGHSRSRPRRGNRKGQPQGDCRSRSLHGHIARDWSSRAWAASLRTGYRPQRRRPESGPASCAPFAGSPRGLGRAVSPDPALCHYLLKQSRAGLKKDAAIWGTPFAHGDFGILPASDTAVIAFREFWVLGFRAGPSA